MRKGRIYPTLSDKISPWLYFNATDTEPPIIFTYTPQSWFPFSHTLGRGTLRSLRSPDHLQVTHGRKIYNTEETRLIWQGEECYSLLIWPLYIKALSKIYSSTILFSQAAVHVQPSKASFLLKSGHAWERRKRASASLRSVERCECNQPLINYTVHIL